MDAKDDEDAALPRQLAPKALASQCQRRSVVIWDPPFRLGDRSERSGGGGGLRSGIRCCKAVSVSTTPPSLPARRRPPATSIGRRPVDPTLAYNSSPIPPPSDRARAAHTPCFLAELDEHTQRVHGPGRSFRSKAPSNILITPPCLQIHLQCPFSYAPKRRRRVLAEHHNHYTPTYMYSYRLQAEAGLGVNSADEGKRKARTLDDAPVENAAAEDEDGGIACRRKWRIEGWSASVVSRNYPFMQMVQCPEAHLFCITCVKASSTCTPTVQEVSSLRAEGLPGGIHPPRGDLFHAGCDT
ncbi:hypothetical protein BJ912DRAFT_1040033 [Pholiota molesta]|nr:hypothetical protein BJ912DRAFT_1040033 [Pholiota molesta]